MDAYTSQFQQSIVFIQMVLSQAGLSTEKAIQAAQFFISGTQGVNEVELETAIWHEAAQRNGEIFRRHAIVVFQTPEGYFDFLIFPPDDSGLVSLGYKYPNRSRALLAARRYVISATTWDLLEEWLIGLYEADQISFEEYDNLQQSVCYAFSHF